MKAVGLIVLGLLIGALLGAWALKAISAGGEFGRGVMALQAHHNGQLREKLRLDRCDAASLTPHLDALATVARDIEPAFLNPEADDATFRLYAEQMRERVAKAYLGLGDCERMREAVGAISDGCKACHRDYKG